MTMKTNTEFLKFLEENNACKPAIAWLNGRTPEQAYNECQRADWLLWWFKTAHYNNLSGYPSIDQLKKCAIEIARKVKHLAKDDRIETVFNLLDEYLETGNKEKAIEAEKIAWTIKCSATSNDVATNDAITSTVTAAYAAYAYTASYATAAYTAYTASYATADREKMNQECADLVRNICQMKF